MSILSLPWFVWMVGVTGLVMFFGYLVAFRLLFWFLAQIPIVKKFINQ